MAGVTIYAVRFSCDCAINCLLFVTLWPIRVSFEVRSYYHSNQVYSSDVITIMYETRIMYMNGLKIMGTASAAS